MGKKTRKEKIIADLRRKLNPPVMEQILKRGDFPEKEPNTEVPSAPAQTSSIYIYPVQLIKKDLTKTLVLCILAISLEIALFFFLEKHLILPFRINF